MNRDRNSPEMSLALERLAAERIRHEQTSAFQIKLGPFNFYPDKGTIYRDGDQKARPERGLENFLALIGKLRDRKPRDEPSLHLPRRALQTLPGALT